MRDSGVKGVKFRGSSLTYFLRTLTPKQLNPFSMMGLLSGRTCQLHDRAYTSFMKVTAVVHKADEGGFWAEVPSLPGCRTQGNSMDELKANLREAVELYLETDPSGLTADKNSQLLELAV